MEALLKELKANNIAISLDKSDLKIKFNGTELPAGLIGRIRERKPEIVAYLKSITKETADNGIEALGQQDGYILSSSQLRLWILCQLEEANIAFNIQNTAVFEGNLNYAALQSAFTSLIARHEILRTVFKEDGQGGVRQYVRSVEEIGFKIDCRDLRQEKDELLQTLISSVAATPFDLASGPLMRAGLYQVDGSQWVFTYVMHHIISDSWSMEILIRELLLLYNIHCKGAKNPLLPLRIHYKDYAAWEQNRLAGEEMQAARKYWLNQFKEGVPVSDVSKRMRPPVFTYKGGYLRAVIDATTTNNIVKLTQAYSGSVFISLLFFVKLLLFRYTRNHRIMVGTSLAGREHADLENQIGLYINNLPLITAMQEEQRLGDFYINVKQTVVNALQHQSYPLDVLVNEIGYKPDRSRPGLFNVSVELHTEVINEQPSAFEGFNVRPYDKQFTTTNFDLGFEFKKLDNEIDVLIMYNIDLFSSEEMELMKERFMKLLQLANEFNGDKPIADTGYLISQEQLVGRKTSLKFDMEEKF